jgi:hypothetical protein
VSDYCPNFEEILGTEGGTIENVLAANCSAFHRMSHEFVQSEAATRLALMHGMLGLDRVGEIAMNQTLTEQEQRFLDYLRQGASSDNSNQEG